MERKGGKLQSREGAERFPATPSFRLTTAAAPTTAAATTTTTTVRGAKTERTQSKARSRKHMERKKNDAKTIQEKTMCCIVVEKTLLVFLLRFKFIEDAER